MMKESVIGALHCQKCHTLVATCQQVITNLSISSSCNKSVKIRLVATCHLQICYNLLAETTCSKAVDDKFSQSNCSLQVCSQLATNLLSTCCRKPCKRILIISCFNKSVARCQQTCCIYGCILHFYHSVL